MCGAPYMVMFLAPRRDGCGVVRFLAGIPGVVTDGRTRKKKKNGAHNTRNIKVTIGIIFISCCFVVVSTDFYLFSLL